MGLMSGLTYDVVIPGDVCACRAVVRLEGFGGGNGGSYAFLVLGL